MSYSPPLPPPPDALAADLLLRRRDSFAGLARCSRCGPQEQRVVDRGQVNTDGATDGLS
jgi:hypothetical protein